MTFRWKWSASPLVPLIATLVLLSACAQGLKPKASSTAQTEGDTLVFRYAQLPTVVRYAQGYTTVTIGNPWKPGRTLHRYVLVPRDRELPSSLPEGTLLRTPLSRTVVFTTVHCAMLLALDCGQSISGVADLKYIKLPWIQQQVSSGAITDVGDGLSPVVEKIIDQHPDALRELRRLRKA